MVGALILAINFASAPNAGTLTISLAIVAALALAAFVIRQRRATNPLYDLHVAAAHVLGGGLRRDHRVRVPDGGGLREPAVPPERARLEAPYRRIGIAYAFIGIGVGFAGTPASHSLTGSVPVRQAGMASGTADLLRDLGGAIMQSIFGALLTAGYASAAAAGIAAWPQSDTVSDNVEAELTKSFSSAANTAERYPQYADQIVAGARAAFLEGDRWAYTAGTVAVLIGGALVFLCFPRRDAERALLARYAAEDAAAPVTGARRSAG